MSQPAMVDDQMVTYNAVVEEPKDRRGGHRGEGPLQVAMRAEAMTRPHVWVSIAQYDKPGTARSVTHLLRSGRRKPPPGTDPRDWEWKTGILDDGRPSVWARYKGPQ